MIEKYDVIICLQQVDKQNSALVLYLCVCASVKKDTNNHK